MPVMKEGNVLFLGGSALLHGHLSGTVTCPAGRYTVCRSRVPLVPKRARDIRGQVGPHKSEELSDVSQSAAEKGREDVQRERRGEQGVLDNI